MTLNNFGRLPLEMNFDKLMTTMRQKDLVTKEKDDLIKEKEAQIMKSLEERDHELFDALTDAIRV